MNWTELLKFIGGGTAFLAIAAWLIRSLTLQVFSRDIERYKSVLKKEADKEIESLKNSLNIEALKHQIRFSKLQERRVSVIEETYKRIVSLEKSSAYLTTEARTEDYVYLKDKADKFIDEFFEFNSFFESHAIYFPENIANKIKDFNDLIFNLSINIVYHSSPKSIENFIEAFRKEEKSFKSRNQEIRRYIESEFRKLLGVTD
ncbi:hypothetical protein [Leptolyngbya sp. CCY15150]|uniref:hypothetical protein n=1 Tax=Leptolyngbya sp. CCY15150 TaxID=2767772 RepID=UPI00194E9242|nr:hypothetical protein [Leptolyngbya sp. CCY15150]